MHPQQVKPSETDTSRMRRCQKPEREITLSRSKTHDKSPGDGPKYALHAIYAEIAWLGGEWIARAPKLGLTPRT